MVARLGFLLECMRGKAVKECPATWRRVKACMDVLSTTLSEEKGYLERKRVWTAVL